ncbi:hypothetical protein NW762_008948 [Fusarium torreyae]|uniref:Uncharacterized protein n=1 Tax=Fusarium torreyae TaxID=1237075 RepID=A0A9W8RWN8_9HYPO|nr:hypothetical protein NW762_008948 [Fusarium torreyae]
MYFLGCFTNKPRKAANNAGVFRSFMAAGEAVAFAVDSGGLSCVIQAGIILGFYASIFSSPGYLAIFVITNTRYFQEDEVTIPGHIVTEQTAVTNVEEAQDSTCSEKNETELNTRSNWFVGK